MKKLIKFNTNCFDAFDGTSDELEHIISQIKDICLSEDLVIDHANSITYDADGFDQIIEIKLGDK